MRVFLLLLLALIFFSACGPNKDFKKLETEIQQSGLLQISLYDESGLNTFSPEKMDSLFKLSQSYLLQLQSIEKEQLREKKRKRLLPLNNSIIQLVQEFESLRSNASLYNLARILKQKVSEYKKIEQQIRATRDLIEMAPAFYQAAKTKLQSIDTSGLETAIESQLEGLIILDELKGALKKSKLDQKEKKIAERNIVSAKLAFKDYLAFCESARKNIQNSKYSPDF